MNRLADETSPYLLQHADNPVDWHAWGEEALERANDSFALSLTFVAAATSVTVGVTNAGAIGTTTTFGFDTMTLVAGTSDLPFSPYSRARSGLTYKPTGSINASTTEASTGRVNLARNPVFNTGTLEWNEDGSGVQQDLLVEAVARAATTVEKGESELELLERDSVLVTPGSGFNVPYRNHIRVTLLPEPSRIAGVMPTMRESAAAMSHSQSPNTCV